VKGPQARARNNCATAAKHAAIPVLQLRDHCEHNSRCRSNSSARMGSSSPSRYPCSKERERSQVTAHLRPCGRASRPRPPRGPAQHLLQSFARSRQRGHPRANRIEAIVAISLYEQPSSSRNTSTSRERGGKLSVRASNGLAHLPPPRRLPANCHCVVVNALIKFRRQVTARFFPATCSRRSARSEQPGPRIASGGISKEPVRPHIVLASRPRRRAARSSTAQN